MGELNNKQISFKYRGFQEIFRAIIFKFHKLLHINDLRRAARHKPLMVNELQLSSKKRKKSLQFAQSGSIL
ncbi:hypothetical protein CMI37_27860 [Candidatus Pacearchaeota archaeon]|nr:hypothetical protein [Candidatus Pacearchaeota archaeon]